MRDENAYLRDMLDSAFRIQKLVSGRTSDQFINDEMLRDAVAWRLTTIGETARGLNDETRRGIPAVSWGQLIRLRRRLVHTSADVRNELLWTTVRNDLPILITQLEAYLRSISQAGGTP